MFFSEKLYLVEYNLFNALSLYLNNVTVFAHKTRQAVGFSSVIGIVVLMHVA